MTLDALAQSFPSFAQARRLQRSGELDKARTAYLDLMDNPVLVAPCLHQLAEIAAQRGETPRALDLLRQAIRLEPGEPLFRRSLSIALDRSGQAAAALDALVDFGCALQAGNNHQEAVPVYQNVLRADASRYAAWANLGTAFALLKNPTEAANHLLRAVALYARRDAGVGEFVGQLLQRLPQGRLNLDMRGTLPPGHPTGTLEKIEDILTSLGTALGELGCAQQAIACHRMAIKCAPGFALAHWNLALCLLADGQYQEGWSEFEWRWRWPQFSEIRRHQPLPPWRGEPLAGRCVLVYAEQGFGDTLQFASLVKRLCDQAEFVIFQVYAPLTRLLHLSFGSERLQVTSLLPDPDAAGTEQRIDCAVPLMSLPHLMRLSRAELPLAQNYLVPDPDDALRWAKKLDTPAAPRVGIAWAGRPNHQMDHKRSLPLAALQAMVDFKGVHWVSLQMGPRAQEADAMPQALAAPLAQSSDFADTAALISHLDLVISVDTAIAHLAAGMGKPVWLLLPSVSDWRWGRDDNTTCWYPSVRIFRQLASNNDWAAVIDGVRLELVRLFQIAE